MFKEIDYDKQVPPNFLNSILTNPSLYKMFKDEFEENKEYFQGIPKEVYLSEMLNFISDTLFSTNLFHIYGEREDLDKDTEGKLSYIKTFYDDFLLDAFKENPKNILKTRLFRGLEFAKENDKFASSTKEFNNLYEYVFNESLDYFDIVDVLIKVPLVDLLDGNTLSMQDFDTLCYYVKNNINGTVDINIVTAMLHNHAYKINHIFDTKVAECLITSTIKDYLASFNINVKLEFPNGLENIKDQSSLDRETNTIYLDKSLLDGFVLLNYVELFEHAFYEADKLKNLCLVEKNEVNYNTLNAIMTMISLKVDLLELEESQSSTYDMDLHASSFIKTLRFFSTFGVNLVNNFVESKSRKIDLDIENGEELIYSNKEISLDQRFFKVFKRLSNKQELVKHFNVLQIILTKDGDRKKTIDLIKCMKDSNEEFILEYLHSRVIEPTLMIDDVNELSNYNPKDNRIREIIENELKYIYVDTFFYSLDSYIKLNTKPSFDIDEYLDDLTLKVNCIKNTPLTHRFIDEALFTIQDAKQNY